MVFRLLLICIILCFSTPAHATTYWVDHDGAATWANCTGEEKSGAAACSTATMAAGAVSAGDIIYFRGGDYTYASGIAVSISGKNGKIDSLITYQNYDNEEVNLYGTYGSDVSGLSVSNSNYIKISGLNFYDFGRPGRITNGSTNIEVTDCTFETETSPYKTIVAGFMIDEDCGGGASYRCPTSHVWFHDNTIFKVAAGGGCTSVISEGGDGFRIGYASNTCSATELGTSTGSMLMEVASKTFATQAGISLIVGDAVKLQNDSTHYMIGDITAYSGTSMTVNVRYIIGEGTFESWSIRNCVAGKNMNITVADNYMAYAGHAVMDSYSQKSVFRNNIAHNEPWYPADNGECTVTYAASYTNTDYNNLYSHRVWQITDTYQSTRRENLLEGNRLGHAGVNPNNDGATGLTIASPGNIIRYNSAFSTMHNPMKTKYGTGSGWQGNGAQNCKIYNNTLYKGGYGYPYFQTCTNPLNSTCPKPLVGFRFYLPNVQPNFAFKNNIVTGSYGAVTNSSEDIQDDSSTGIAFANNFCTQADAAKCTQTGDPLFVDNTLTPTTSLTLPNLNVQSGSNAIGNGAALTTAVGAGTNHSVLTVVDAGYFQDGTAGSDLARIYGTMVPDKIAIGTVTNIVEIEAVDYANNRIFLKHAMTWADNASVWLYSKSDGMRVLNTAQDIGSHPYQIPVTYAPWVH